MFSAAKLTKLNTVTLISALYKNKLRISYLSLRFRVKRPFNSTRHYFSSVILLLYYYTGGAFSAYHVITSGYHVMLSCDHVENTEGSKGGR